MTPLHALSPSVRPLLDENFRSGELPIIDSDQYVMELSRVGQIDIDPLLSMITEAMRRFRNDPDKSDGWLAPRVHATFRLTRREAGDRRIWYWLNVVAKPDYVRWRFGGEGAASRIVALDRFMGEDSKNAIGRLWWAAELTRNGKDYSETESILRTSRFFTSWQPLDAMHHRAATIAVCRFARNFNGGKGLTDSQSARLAKAFNLRLTTLGLDALAWNPPVDVYAVQEWCAAPVDETKYMDELPEGPDEEPTPEVSIQAVVGVLQTLADEIDLAEFKRHRSKAANASNDDTRDNAKAEAASTEPEESSSS